jgi:exosortase
VRTWLPWIPSAGIALWWLYDLQVQWRARPEYQYGWLVVLLAVYLASERWPAAPPADSRSPRWIPALLVALGTPLILLAELYKQAIAHTPAASFSLSLACVLFLGANLVFLRGWPTLRHFLFPILFMFVAVPIPNILWNPVVLGLQDMITSLNVEALKILGVPAVQQGNVIRLPTCAVGVDEACSGVRSLQSSLMVALFVGDLVLRRFWPRLAFLLAGIVLALTGNFLRSLYLSLTAHRYGLEALDRAHDTAGWTILVFTGAGLALAAWGFTRLQHALRQPSCPHQRDSGCR